MIRRRACSAWLGISLKRSEQTSVRRQCSTLQQADTSKSMSQDLRAILSPSSTLSTARGRIDAAGAAIAQHVLRMRSSTSVPIPKMPPMVALELLRLVVDQREAGALHWLIMAAPPTSSVQLPSGTGALICESLLQSLVDGFVGVDPTSGLPRIADRDVNVVTDQFLRLVVGIPLVCEEAVKGASLSRAEDIQNGASTLIQCGLALWKQHILMTESRAPLKFIPTAYDVLFSATWAAASTHSRIGDEDTAPLYLVLLRLAHVIVLGGDAYRWQLAFSNETNAPMVHKLLGEYILFPKREQQSLSLLSQRVQGAWMEPSCHPSGAVGPLVRLVEDVTATGERLRFVRTEVVVHGDDRMRQLLLLLARLPMVRVSHGSRPILIDLNANRAVDVGVLREGFGSPAGAAKHQNQQPATETYLRCLLPLKSWLDICAESVATSTASEPLGRPVQLSFQFVSSILVLCLLELRDLMAENTKRLLDQKPRVHLLKETVELLKRVGTARLFPEVSPEEQPSESSNDMAQHERHQAERLLRDILHSARFLVRKVMGLKSAALKEEGTVGALLTGGVDHSKLKEDEMLRNAAYRVVEPLIKRWYQAVDPAAELSWGYARRQRAGDSFAPPLSNLTHLDLLRTVQEVHQHVGLVELLSASDVLCLRHPMQNSLLTLLEVWRSTCFRVTVVVSLLARNGASPHLHADDEMALPVPREWAESFAWLRSLMPPAALQHEWSAPNVIRVLELLGNASDVLMQRIEDESSFQQDDGASSLPLKIIQSYGILLVTAAQAVSSMKHDASSSTTANAAIVELGQRTMGRLRDGGFPDPSALYRADHVSHEDFLHVAEEASSADGSLDLWLLAEKFDISLPEARTLRSCLLRQRSSPTVAVVATLNEFLANDIGADSGILACRWSRWAAASHPLRFYDEDGFSSQSKEVFEFGATKLGDAAAVASPTHCEDSKGVEVEDDDAAAPNGVEVGTASLANWKLLTLSLQDEIRFSLG